MKTQAKKQPRPNEEFNAGAQETRNRILRYLRNLRDTSEEPLQDLEGAICWIKGMAKRSAKRVGGQGRK